MNRFGQRRISLAIPFVCLFLVFSAASVYSEYAWLPEFEEICGKTDESGSMTKEELKAMITRCDNVRPQIEKADHPQKNVFLFRLDKCRKLFLYVLELDEK